MPKLLSALMAVAIFLMAIMSSCLSQEQKALKAEVESMNANLPAEVAGVTLDNIFYNTDTEQVTLQLVANNAMAEAAARYTSSMLKQGLILYLRSSEGNPDLVYAIRKANATLVCPCFDQNDNEIASFTISPEELN